MNRSFTRKIWLDKLFILLAVATPAVASAQSDPVRIGVLTTLTGNWAAVGENVMRGATLAVDEINAKGGVKGRPLELTAQDTDEELSGSKVISAYMHLRNKGYKLFIGPTGVPGSNALGPLAGKDDVVIITSAALTHFERFGANHFNIIGDSERTSKAAAEWAYRKGFRTASVLRSDQPWEYSQGDFFADGFKGLGGTVLSIQDSPGDEKEFRVQALRISKEKPQLVFLATFNQVSFAAKALANVKATAPKACALLDDAHLAAAGGTLEGATFFLFRGPAEDLRNRYTEKFHAPPGYASDYSYDAIQAFTAAINSAGSDEPSAVRTALSNVEFAASIGTPMRFTDKRFVEREIRRYEVRGGKIVEEKKAGLASGE